MSGSSCMSGSSEHNSTMALFKLTSSCFHCTTIVAALRYFLSTWSHSYLSATFSILTSCSLSLNSSAICTWRVLIISEGNVAKSSCAAPSCSPSCALGWHMLIGVTEMNQCQVPTGSITMLYVVVGVATYGAWLTNVFNSVSCVLIICFSASCVDANVVIGSDMLSQTLSAMVLKLSSCNTA